ncbi:hypothetical protein ACVW00_003543 [Marmoricola sp. URHA0025 HA25]
MSSAGQANEAGSVARRNAGTYLAVYMLAGLPVDALENFKAISHVGFESSDPTDDIVLTFDGGARGFVSSKRKVTYGAAFKGTVAGWVAQLDEVLDADDLLILVCEEAAEWVRNLADALARIRGGGVAESRRHVEALARLDGEVPAGKRDEVRRRARILELPRVSTNNDSRAVLALMMEQLVEGNVGAAAVSAIAERVHEWASRANGFDADKLVDAIASAEIVVHADSHGSAAAQAAAKRNAVDGYLGALARSNGRVDLTFLAEDLNSFVVEDLLANVRVTSRVRSGDGERDLRLVLRRYGRMLVVGQPGSGKSLAMRELAGWAAMEPDAPTPVTVHLPDLLPRHRDRTVTVDDLVAVAATRSPGGDRVLVEGFLADAVADGDALLLLDGLDECRTGAPWMAEQLQTLVAGLPPLVAVVVATRGTMAVPGERIGLPRVDLQRPFNLDETIDAVLVQCANVRVRDPADRADWLRVRREWLSETKNHQAGMLEVPQLALLVTLILGSTSDLEVPKRRAELLHEAVRQSVMRWEHKRFRGALDEDWALELTPAMLVDGFVVLGRLLEDRATAPERGEALAALNDMLVDAQQWSLSGAKARELAGEVLRFWDSHVAVFVLDEEDRLTSRSRVFTEVATAMWTTRCSAQELLTWAAEAVRFEDSEGVVALALGLNDKLVEMMLDLGDLVTEATLAVASAFTSDAITLSAEQVTMLVEQTGRHASDIQGGARQPPERQTRDERPWAKALIARWGAYPASWPLIEVLCSMKLAGEHRRQRDEALGRVPLDADDAAAAAAWIALSDAQADRRQLTHAEVEVVSSVLARDVPETRKPFRVDGVLNISSSSPLDPGVSHIARNAIEFLGQLPEGAPELIYKLSYHVPHRFSVDMRSELRDAGYNTEEWEDPSPGRRVLAAMEDRDYEEQVLKDAASIGDASIELSKHERWRLPHLAELIDITGYGHVSNPDFTAAFVSDDAELRRRWLKALAHASQLDADRVAAEAALALSRPFDQFATPPDWSLVSYGGLDEVRAIGGLSLDAEDQAALLDSMHAASHWIAFPALYILANVVPTWDTDAFFDIDRSDWPPYRASECYLLALLVSPNRVELAAKAAGSSEPARRHAAARAIEILRELDPKGELRTLIYKDEDMWVREDHNPLDPPARFWTCRWCGQSNEPSNGSCVKCDLSSRPGPRQPRTNPSGYES